MGVTNGLNKFAPRRSARYFASKPVSFFANRRTYGDFQEDIKHRNPGVPPACHLGATNGLNKFAPRKSARYFASKPVPFFANRRTYGARSYESEFDGRVV